MVAAKRHQGLTLIPDWLAKAKFVRVTGIQGDSPEDTTALSSMAKRAAEYLTKFHWCPPVAELRLQAGIGGVVAVFQAILERKIDESDDRLWVVVGDLPPAYLVVNSDDESAATVLETYCGLMEDWVDAVKTPGASFDSVFPVEAERTLGNALQLSRSRSCAKARRSRST